MVGGLHNLKRWIERRQAAFLETDAGKDMPRGILLVGVQGGGEPGRTGDRRAVVTTPAATGFRYPVQQVLPAETERNLREALQAAEAMAPCVWIDEIEKAIASGDSDSGTSRRILGNLLTWMAERRTPVFIVATANVIEHLPPELIRKGRLDEIFSSTCRIPPRAKSLPPAQTGFLTA